MVYNGPSTGCLTCRKRKVRCDKLRPACNNCTKRKQQCPGYGNVFDARHRDQTRAIIARADQKTTAPSPKPYLTPSTSSPGTVYSRVASSRASPLSDPEPLSKWNTTPQDDFASHAFTIPVNLEASAIAFFFQGFGRALGDCRAVHGFMPDLAPVYRNAPVQSPLHAATAAIAMNMYMLFAHKGSDTKQARSLYLQAVSGLKESLSRPDPKNFDELLMAVLALDFYDMINCRFWPDAPRTDHHKRGALAMLKHRGASNFATQLSQIMVAHVRTNMGRWLLNDEIDLSPDVLAILTHPSLPNKNQNVLDALTLRLALLMSKFRSLQQHEDFTIGTAPSENLERLLDEALLLDEAMIDWETSIPARWFPIILTPDEVEPTIRTAGMWNNRCPVYADLAICDVYNTYREVRLILLQLIQQLCLSSRKDDSADIFDYKGQIMQRLIDEICEALPFCVGDARHMKIGSIVQNVKYPTTWKNGQPFPHPSVDHPNSAIASGGWQIYTVFTELVRSTTIRRGLVPLQIPPRQLQWMKTQLRRIEVLYDFPLGVQ